MKVHEARRYVHTSAINNVICVTMTHSADLHNLTAGDSEIGSNSRRSAAIENKAVLHNDVKTHIWHTSYDLIQKQRRSDKGQCVGENLCLESVAFYIENKTTQLVCHAVLVDIDV